MWGSPPCYTIELLTLSLAKNTPRNSSPILDCTQNYISAVSWLEKESLAYISNVDGKTEVKELSISSKELKSIYKENGENPYDLAYSRTKKKLAILQENLARLRSVVILNRDSGAETLIALQGENQNQQYGWSGISWHPTKDVLLTAIKHSLFEITLDGEFTEHPFPTYQGIYDPAYHPDGRQITATLGIADYDVRELTWGDNQETQSRSLYRSIVVDGYAKYQPYSDGIAFISERSGRPQLWYGNGESLKQISQLSGSEWLQSFAWSPQGKPLVVNINGQLNLLNTRGEMEILAHSFKVLDIYQWGSDNEILLSILKDKHAELVHFNIVSGDVKTVYQGAIRWAQVDEQQNYYFSDVKGVLHTIAHGETLAKLISLESVIHNRFFVSNGSLVFSDDKGVAWQYWPATKRIKPLNHPESLPIRLDDVDTSNMRLLSMHHISRRKEVVVFH